MEDLWRIAFERNIETLFLFLSLHPREMRSACDHCDPSQSWHNHRNNGVKWEWIQISVNVSHYKPFLLYVAYLKVFVTEMEGRLSYNILQPQFRTWKKERRGLILIQFHTGLNSCIFQTVTNARENLQPSRVWNMPDVVVIVASCWASILCFL